MRWALAALIAGLAGCTLIIGDIPIPPPESADNSAYAGVWHVYGLTSERVIQARISLDATGRLSDGFEIEDEPRLWLDPAAPERAVLDLSPYTGELTGRIDAELGVGVLVPSNPQAAALVLMVREPAGRGSLPAGRLAQTGLFVDGVLQGETAHLIASSPTEFTELDRYALDGSSLTTRTLAAFQAPDQRWALRTERAASLDRLLTAQTGWAVGVRRRDRVGVALSVLFGAPPAARLPSVDVWCGGLVSVGGTPTVRIAQGRFGETVEWLDGRSGSPEPIADGLLLPAEAGFFEDQGGLVRASADERVFAIVPLRPDLEGGPPALGWGIALCLAAEGPGDAALPDVGFADAGVGDAGAIELDAESGAADMGPLDVAPLDMAPPDAALVDMAPVEPPADMAPVDPPADMTPP